MVDPAWQGPSTINQEPSTNLMNRHRTYGPRDDPAARMPQERERFRGVNNRLAPDQLPAGLLAGAENYRMRDGTLEPRLGVIKPGFLNQTNAIVDGDETIRPVGTFYGVASFKDPNGVEWTIQCADGFVYRCRPHNERYALAMPTGVKILSRCVPVQAFNKVWLFRGRYLPPLVINDLDTGVEDIVELWNATDTFAAGAEVAYGPFQSVTSISSVADVATVVTAVDHGYITGMDITISGAVETEYNGRFNITVVDAVTFTYHFAGSATAASGTITASNMILYWEANAAPNNPSAGQSPDTHPSKWTQIYDILPHADDAIFMNNRLLVPTAYTPGDTDDFSDASGLYTKKDFLIATDVLDELHFDFATEFRVNQGADDEIVTLIKYNQDTAIIVKNRSWAALNGVRLDLGDLVLDMRADGYGAVAPAIVVAGRDVIFASQRGLVSLKQNELGIVNSVDIPFSNDIQGYVRRIKWTFADKQRLAYWDDKLYWAVALDAAEVLDAPVPIQQGEPGPLLLATIVPGEVYVWTAGNGVSILTSAGTFTTDARFTAVDSVVFIVVPATGWTGKLQRVRANVNNALLVYDFRLEAWQGVDTGSEFCVKEFWKLNYNGLERLAFIGENGFANIIEEAIGDQIEDTTADNCLGWSEIETAATGRGLAAGTDQPKAFKRLDVVLAIWDARFTLTCNTGAAFQEQTIREDKEFSRTKYLKPFDKADYVEGNVNGDHATPGRGNYSVPLDADGVLLGDGLTASQYQEAAVRASVRSLAHRYIQFSIRNDQGRCRVVALGAEASEGQRRDGVIV
jgi:hypothetical protein